MRGIHLALAVLVALSAVGGAREASSGELSGGIGASHGHGAIAALADLVVVEKSARRLTLYSRGQPIGHYRVALGSAPQGHKLTGGDDRTPEGVYAIDRRNPRSAFYLSIGISYPDTGDLRRAQAAGVEPGGNIFIHGQPNGSAPGQRLAYDWTNGCVAVSDQDMYEIWRKVPTGTPVVIRP